LRSYDLSALDLRGSAQSLAYANFDSQTIWPPVERMPTDFDWQLIFEMGKNPGLEVRQLHAQGITGRGVGLAIVDQPLLTAHQEYADRLRWYEEINHDPSGLASMHGPAVASISLGWKSFSPGYYDIMAVVEAARVKGVLVVFTTMEDAYGFDYAGLGREPLTDPDAFESYEPGIYLAQSYYANPPLADSPRLLAPMDSRTTASATGAQDYVFFRGAGKSWPTPYIAGVYALAVQVDPLITPERFWALALETGRTIQVQHEGRLFSLGPVVDPAALIKALQR
jgi:subtilisin family serine protease